MSFDGDPNVAVDDLGGVGPEIDAGRQADCFPGAVIEGAGVLRTFDLEVHHQPVGEVHDLMAAQAVGAPDTVVRAAVDRERPRAQVKAEDALLLDVVETAVVSDPNLT